MGLQLFFIAGVVFDVCERQQVEAVKQVAYSRVGPTVDKSTRVFSLTTLTCEMSGFFGSCVAWITLMRTKGLGSALLPVALTKPLALTSFALSVPSSGLLISPQRGLILSGAAAVGLALQAVTNG